MRWSLQLQTYDFEVKYRPGKDLGHADGLSRPAADDEDQNSPPKIPEGEMSREKPHDRGTALAISPVNMKQSTWTENYSEHLIYTSFMHIGT